MKRLIATVALFVLTAFLSGCATPGVNLVETGNVIVKVVPTEDEYISSAHVYRNGKQLIISGRVHSSRGEAPLEKGHIDVEIMNPGGTPIKECAYYFDVVPRKLDNTAPFAAYIPALDLPHGTIIRLTYHHITSSEEILSRCSP